MKNLKRFRSWIALIAAVTWNYLQQLGTSRSTAAEDRPNNAPETSSSAGAVTERQTGQVASKPITKAATVQTTVDVAPVNGQAHQSAQRLARVLISEIKLYYMDKIDGQDPSETQNIYDLLKDPIDKSRQHYRQRVGTEVSMPDYFHGELVKTLCEGDPSRLGPNYSSK